MPISTIFIFGVVGSASALRLCDVQREDQAPRLKFYKTYPAVWDMSTSVAAPALGAFGQHFQAERSGNAFLFIRRCFNYPTIWLLFNP